MTRPIVSIITAAALAAIILAGRSLAADEVADKAVQDGTIRREGWSFDRSELNWYDSDPAKIAEQKAKGTFWSVAGWTEFDFEVPAPGWYELCQTGVPDGWFRNVYLDGDLLFRYSATPAGGADMVKDGKDVFIKEANLWLTPGKHTLRYERMSFPACLPARWLLRPAQNRPEASIRVAEAPHNVVRAGERLEFTFLGGAIVPLAYELVLQNPRSPELIPVGRLEFPAAPGAKAPLKRAVGVTFPKEGQFLLLAKVGDTLLRPADLKAGLFTVIDTKAPPAAKELKTTPLIEIDCVAQTLNGKPVEPGVNYFENRCRTDVVRRPFGSYRESAFDTGRVPPILVDGKAPTEQYLAEREKRHIHGYERWGCESFAYKFDLPEANQLYRLQVDYPDDDRRTMGFNLQDFPGGQSYGSGGFIQGGGVETGDHYPLSHSLKTHESYFFCRNPKGLVIPVVNLLPGWKAAAARIRIARVEGGLPAVPNPEPRTLNPAHSGRAMGFYFEEPGRWDSYFGGDPALPTSFETMARWARWNRRLGANLLFPTVMCYNGIMWPTKVWRHTGTVAVENTPRMLALVAEKYGQQFVPEMHVSVNILELDPEKNKAEFDELVVRDQEGNTQCSWMGSVFNALHPRVQDKYVELVGELADNCKDSSAFAGVSCRLMLGWQWAGYNALPGLRFGYEDWTIARFEKETGIQVPGKDGDPGRFKQRFDFLTGPQKEQWLAWRCRKIFTLHQRVRDRIQQARPGARLFLNYFGPDERCALSGDKLEQMREVGLDPRYYRNEPGIVVITGGAYGRRDSSPLMDAGKLDALLYSPFTREVARWGDRGYCLYTDYFEYGHAAEFDRLGGKDVFINDACVPNDIHEREIYATALADNDSSFIINGGAGWMFGTPRLMQPFLREYRALPAIPFEPVAAARDPVAVWQAEGFFYAVNRLPVAVEVAIKMKGWFKKVYAAADGAPVKLDGDTLRFTLEPYMLKSFCAEGWRVAVESGETKVPAEFVAKVKPIVEFCRELSADLKAGRVAPEFSQADFAAAIAGLDAAVAGFDKGEYGKAWRVDSLPLVKLYTAAGRFPPGMWERSKPHGLPAKSAAAPRLEPAGFLGDARGRLPGCMALDVAPDGKLWAASPDKVMRFGADGRYEKHLPLFRPRTPHTELVFPAPLNSTVSLIALSKNRIGSREWPDPLWAFDAESGRTHMETSAAGIPMKHPAVPLAVTGTGDVLVAANGENRGVYKYRADGSPACDFTGQDPLYRLCPDGANGGAVDAEGRIYLTPLSGGVKIFSAEGKELAHVAPGGKFGVMALRADGQLLVAAEGATLQAFRRGPDGAFAPAWQAKLPALPTGLKFLGADRLAVGFNAPDPDGAVVREYPLTDAGALAGKALVRGVEDVENGTLSGFTQLKTRDNAVYYGAHKKLWRLMPGADHAELVYDPNWPAHVAPFEAFAFAPNGDLYLAAHNGAGRGINLYRVKKTDPGYGALEYLNGGKALFEAWYAVPTDLEVDGNGEVIVRLLNPEAKPADKTVSLFRWSPETGKRELIRDVGATFNGNGYGDYGLHRLADGGLLIAGGTTRVIQRLAPDGTTLWSKSLGEHYLPGAFDTLQPLGITADSQGRVWVADTARHRILCLSAEGEFLGAYGHFGTMDDRGGLGLNSPVGVATVKDAQGTEYLYVADTGNQRIAKFVIREAGGKSM
jgi:sugar lactone lactonase YvrE